MFKLRRILALALVAALALALVACGNKTNNDTAPQGGAEAAPEEVIELRWSIAWPVSNHVNQNLAPWFVEEISKRTNGRVKITIFNGGELLDVPGTYEGIVNGIADMGTSRFGSTPGRFPIMSAFEMPGFNFNNTYVANYTFRDLVAKYNPPDIQDTHLLWIDSPSPAYLYTKMPVSRLEDIQGRQIRGDGMVGEALLALGATPVSISINDAYIALQNNVAEGILDAFGGLQLSKLGEVTDYMILVRGINPGACFFNTMNLDKWNSLPPDIQEIFTQLSIEAMEYSTKMFWDYEEVGVQFGYDEGMKAMLLNPGEDARWLEAIKVVEENWINAGDDSFDRAAMMADFKASIAKYNAEYPDRWPSVLEELYPDISVG